MECGPRAASREPVNVPNQDRLETHPASGCREHIDGAQATAWPALTVVGIPFRTRILVLREFSPPPTPPARGWRCVLQKMVLMDLETQMFRVADGDGATEDLAHSVVGESC